MDYIELNIPVADPEQADILTAFLSDWPFESFQYESGALKAYIPQERMADCKGEIDELLAGQGIAGARMVSIETQNWNAVWESNFRPVDVDGRVMIRAPFHEAPAAGVTDIVIMPKMSFGTGHHATTWLMTKAVADGCFEGLEGLDMGSGTGVLAIAAVKYGAAHVDAVDIDEWAYENSIENIAANGVSDRITPLLGDASVIAGRRYDFILANINRNILLADMPRYASAMRDGGRLYMSGILEADVDAVVSRASEFGFAHAATHLHDGWAMVEVVRDNG